MLDAAGPGRVRSSNSVIVVTLSVCAAVDRGRISLVRTGNGRDDCCPCGDLWSPPPFAHRVINSAAIFTCGHAYVATGDRQAPLLVCTLCSYQTEELPLPYDLLKRWLAPGDRAAERRRWWCPERSWMRVAPPYTPYSVELDP